MNEIGLLGLALLATGSPLLVSGIIHVSWVIAVLGLPFTVLGVLGLSDNFLFNNKLTKWVLKIK